VIGVVLAAGAGSRLGELTAALPKTLLPVAGERTILELALANLAAAGITDVAVVVGFAADRVRERVPSLERDCGVRLRLVPNDRAGEWNNCYSLWLARDELSDGALVVNGDTVHPASVEHTVLAARGPGVLLALDDRKPLAEEEMKVELGPSGRAARISKGLDPAAAAGEYIGVSLVEPAAAERLAAALEATWRRDPSRYYEDGYQEFLDRGSAVGVAPIGVVDWVEVDTPADLARAREIACHY